LSSTLGLQLPDGITKLDPNTIIRKFSKKSTTSNEKSSNQIEQFSLRETNEVLFYAKKKRVSALLATHGLQLPARLSTTNFTTIIADNSENVNPDKNEKSPNQAT